MHNSMGGVSLIELMVALAILGILLAISFPSYQQHVLRSYRSEATSSLLQLANAQEQYRADHGVYSSDFSALGGAAQSPSARYRLSITLLDAEQGFELAATAQGLQQADTACSSFTLNHYGQRNMSIPASVDCWQ